VSIPVIDIENVSKSYDDILAVDRVSLRVETGQTLGLIGPNGAGKTTLLRIISTLAIPERGDVRIHGQSVRTNPRSVRLMLGFMPAEFGSPRNLTIGEYLDYFSCMYAIPKRDRAKRIQEICELTELRGREDVMVKGLSTGNRQRLLLAKTLIHDPQILVLDEPASGLDPRARTELRGIVRALASMGKTIIISSHILPDIEDISDQICILEAGKLVLDGNLDTLRDGHRVTSRPVRIRVLPQDTERTMDALKHLPAVTLCELRQTTIVINTDIQNRNFLLAELLKQQIRVLQFVEDEPSLEEIFMKSTAGKVT
jgi:ABC-2 type transport system ATP-binding protein